MSLNNIINTDVKRSHDYHCVVIENLGDKVACSFFNKTPTLIVRGIKRLLPPMPPLCKRTRLSYSSRILPLSLLYDDT